MVRPAQLRNKLLICTLLMVVVCDALICYRQQPLLSLNACNPYLNQREGILYYEGKPFTGSTFKLFANGNIARKTSYRDGREDGVMQSWYPGKALEQQRYFVDGKKTGIHRGWWPNGKLKFEYVFENDEHNGPAKEWFSNGKLYRFFHYNNGHENGLQQMWWSDGSIRANYVVKDGQQYGLIGRKLCRNIIK